MCMRFDGIDLLGLSPRQRRNLVGKDIAMVFQEPMSSLNPCYPVGWQIGEALRAHHAVAERGGARPGDRTARPGRHPRAGNAA